MRVEEFNRFYDEDDSGLKRALDSPTPNVGL